MDTAHLARVLVVVRPREGPTGGDRWSMLVGDRRAKGECKKMLKQMRRDVVRYPGKVLLTNRAKVTSGHAVSTVFKKKHFICTTSFQKSSDALAPRQQPAHTLSQVLAPRHPDTFEKG